MTTPVKFLEGTSIYLRPRQLDDADWLYQSLNNDGEGRDWGGPDGFDPRADHREHSAVSRRTMPWYGRTIRSSWGASCWIRLTGPYRVRISTCSLTATYTGRDYGTEATSIMLKYGFGILNTMPAWRPWQNYPKIVQSAGRSIRHGRPYWQPLI